MVVTKTQTAVIAEQVSFSSGETRGATIEKFHTPAVCVDVNDLGGLTDDTITIEVVGEVGTYEVDERTLSSDGSYIVDCPQADEVQVTSANGATISAEARNNPR